MRLRSRLAPRVLVLALALVLLPTSALADHDRERWPTRKDAREFVTQQRREAEEAVREVRAYAARAAAAAAAAAADDDDANATARLAQASPSPAPPANDAPAVSACDECCRGGDCSAAFRGQPCVRVFIFLSLSLSRLAAHRRRPPSPLLLQRPVLRRDRRAAVLLPRVRGVVRRRGRRVPLPKHHVLLLSRLGAPKREPVVRVAVSHHPHRVHRHVLLHVPEEAVGAARERGDVLVRGVPAVPGAAAHRARRPRAADVRRRAAAFESRIRDEARSISHWSFAPADRASLSIPDRVRRLSTSTDAPLNSAPTSLRTERPSVTSPARVR